MKCLSVRQPWAWLIVNGFKDVENRTWNTQYRGPLLIHAGKSFDYEALLWMYDNHLFRHVSSIIHHFHIEFDPVSSEPRHHDKAECGGIVGMVDLVDVVTDSKSLWAQDNCYHWVLINARSIPMVQYKGQLGLFEVDENILKGG